MKNDLPKNVHLLTLEPWTQNSILVRFEHIFAKDEDEKYSQPISFDLAQDFFVGINLESIRETTLSANQWLNEVNRLQFKAKMANKLNEMSFQTESIESNDVQHGKHDYTSIKITLKPMEIRTFIAVFTLK